MFYAILATLAALVFAGLYLLSRWNLRQVTEELRAIHAAASGRRLRMAVPDRSLEELVRAVNEILDGQQLAEIAHRRAEKERRDEIANISHDLRTPLTSVLGYLQLLEQPNLSPDEEREYLAIAENRAKALQSLLAGFYDLSRLEADGYPLQREPVQAGAILYQLTADFYADFVEAGMVPMLVCSEKLPLIIADAAALTRIFTNLIQNAIKHGGRTLRIAAQTSDTALCVSFSNEAPNLTEDDCARLFDRFFTADRMRTGQSTGLGLAIVKALCEKMGGSVSAVLCEGELVVETVWPLWR